MERKHGGSAFHEVDVDASQRSKFETLPLWTTTASCILHRAHGRGGRMSIKLFCRGKWRAGGSSR